MVLLLLDEYVGRCEENSVASFIVSVSWWVPGSFLRLVLLSMVIICVFALVAVLFMFSPDLWKIFLFSSSFFARYYNP